eukprot:6206138-Pleurochrysis_carterae.AAC.8
MPPSSSSVSACTRPRLASRASAEGQGRVAPLRDVPRRAWPSPRPAAAGATDRRRARSAQGKGGPVDTTRTHARNAHA